MIDLKNEIWKFRKRLMYYTPKVFAHKWYYKQRTNETLDLENPKNFNEKLQWLIVFKYGKNVSKYADKILVRQYVKSRGFPEILPKIFASYNSSEEIDFDALPDKFVLKTNHASGKEHYEVCVNKNTLDREFVIKKFRKALKVNYAQTSFEYHYKYISPRIFCEEFIDTEDEDGLKDYKLFCFHGNPMYVLVTSYRDTRSGLQRNYFDINWNRVDFLKPEYTNDLILEKPKNFEKAVEIARNLSSPFVFARVDFYISPDRVFFGELTLTPATGINMTYNNETLIKLGNLIDLDSIDQYDY